MSAVTQRCDVSTIKCDMRGCTVTLAAPGMTRGARFILTSEHGWKCDDKARIDLCPIHANPDLAPKS